MNEDEKYLNLTDQEEIKLAIDQIRAQGGMMEISNFVSEQLGVGTRYMLRYIMAVRSSDGELSDLISKYITEYVSGKE